ncbi:MAG TPA: glycosyltransferase family 39 protein [Pyrinomonadaceae bacterium]|nr:glycosyltransferase family 39 protein [Pyrinomonadaceae bacterium]
MEMINYLVWAIAHLGAWALMLLCAAGLGNLFLRKYRFQNLAERLVFTTAIGLGLCALVLFILGLLGMLYQSVIWVLTVSGAVATVSNFLYLHKRWLGIRQWKQFLSIQRWKHLYSLRNAVIASLILIAAGYWVMLLITSQYPPTNWDSISNHLVIARANLTEHSLGIVLGIPQPVLPALNHMLFTWALALKDDVLAQMVVHTFLMLTAVGLYAWGKRQNRPALGCAAAALWLAHPLIRVLGATAYVDIGLTCFVFLGVYALRVFWDGRKASWWYLGIALLAMAAGTKMTGLFFLGLGSLLGWWLLVRSFLKFPSHRSAEQNSEDFVRSQSRFSWRSLVLGSALALLILAPWYGFVSYHTGNPFWPIFAQYSKGIWGAPWVVSGVDKLMIGFKQATIRNFLMLSVDFIRYPARFHAELNLTLFPLIVVWPLAWIVALFNRSVRWWVFWALAYTVFWYLQAPFIRYWLPVLPIAGLALCESIQWILERIRKSASLHNAAWVAASILILLWSGYAVSKQIKGRGLPPATPAAREAFLSQLNGYPGVKYVNAHADKTETVCVLGASWLNYYFHERVIDLWGALYQNRKPTFRWPDDQLWTQWLDYQNVKWIFIYYKSPERALDIPKQNPVVDPFWPDYQLVYADHQTWVFRRKPVPPENR